MIGFGVLAALLAALGLWLMRRRAMPAQPLVLPGRAVRGCRCPSWPTPSAGSSPRWAASPGWCSALMTTAEGVSPDVTA